MINNSIEDAKLGFERQVDRIINDRSGSVIELVDKRLEDSTGSLGRIVETRVQAALRDKADDQSLKVRESLAGLEHKIQQAMGDLSDSFRRQMD